MSLHDLTTAELFELRKRITSAALKGYQAASEYTRAQAALPELSTLTLVREWQRLRDCYAVAISAAQDQFELLEDIAREFARRSLEDHAPSWGGLAGKHLEEGRGHALIDRAADLEQADEDRAAYDDLANRHDDCPRCPHCGLHRHGGQCSPATPVTLGPAYEGPWYCSGCGATYYGVDSHICPVGVRPIVGGAPVGVFGRDWTYE